MTYMNNENTYDFKANTLFKMQRLKVPTPD